MTSSRKSSAAARVRHERERHEWSLSDLSRRVQELGGSLTKQQVSLIERGQRGIDLDEAALLVRVLDLESIEDLMTPMPLVHKRHADELIQAIDSAEVGFLAAMQSLSSALTELFELAENDLDLAEYVKNHLATLQAGRFEKYGSFAGPLPRLAVRARTLTGEAESMLVDMQTMTIFMLLQMHDYLSLGALLAARLGVRKAPGSIQELAEEIRPGFVVMRKGVMTPSGAVFEQANGARNDDSDALTKGRPRGQR